MNADDLKRLVALGEGLRLEFKHRVPRPDRIAREVIALANTGGGTLLVGVADDGELVGVRDAEEERFALETALAAHCEPPVEFAVEDVKVSRRRDVLVVTIPESRTKPHYLIGAAPGGDGAAPNGSAPETPRSGASGRRVSFVRVGANSIEASREAVSLMKAEASGEPARFTFGEREQQLMRYLERYERVTVREYARMAGAPPWRASRTLVLLARAGILRHHADEREDFFTVAYDLG